MIQMFISDLETRERRYSYNDYSTKMQDLKDICHNNCNYMHTSNHHRLEIQNQLQIGFWTSTYTLRSANDQWRSMSVLENGKEDNGGVHRFFKDRSKL